MIVKTIWIITLKILIYFLLIIILLWLLIFLFVIFDPVFWWKPDENSMQKMNNSPNYKNNKFVNLVTTEVMIKSNDENENKFSFFRFFFPPKNKNPETPIPSIKLDKNKLENNSFSWLWHSTILIKINNLTIISDPVFNNASPIPFTWNPFEVENPTLISDIPKIDIVIITHDHYDHLDYKTIKLLWNNVWIYIVPLWVKAHLQRWGIDNERIEEVDWYENINFNWIDFTFAPSRHFSGRNFNNRNYTLWGSWIIKSENKSVYISGDSWYSDEFKKIWEKYWPFDLAFIENWAYNKQWSQIHMMPEQSVQAWIDLNARLVLPIHWAKFDLSTHNWKEPIERFTKEAWIKKLPIITPLIWEIFSTQNYTSKKWREKIWD